MLTGIGHGSRHWTGRLHDHDVAGPRGFSSVGRQHERESLGRIPAQRAVKDVGNTKKTCHSGVGGKRLGAC